MVVRVIEGSVQCKRESNHWAENEIRYLYYEFRNNCPVFKTKLRIKLSLSEKTDRRVGLKPKKRRRHPQVALRSIFSA